MTFTWRDLLVIVRHLPPTSALQRVMHPDEVQWADVNPMLLREVVYRLDLARYQAAGGKGSRPKRIPVPGLESDVDATVFGSEPLPMDEMAAWLGGAFALADRQN